MPISYHNEECNYRFMGRRAISAWLRSCVAREGFGCGQVNIIFCSDDYLLDMNNRYLGHDYYTDVITFDYTEGGTVAGDIYISVDTVARNATEYGTTQRHEMLRVIVHGILHLCGYGDKNPAEQKTMRAKEDLCLAMLMN